MKTMTDLDYVRLYAKNMKENKELFKQQKNLVEAQIISSRLLFKNSFGKDFKKEARKYLKSVGLI